MSWFKSLITQTQEKINSPFYATLIVSIIIWNWKSFYVLFFLKSDVLQNKPQIDYVLEVSRNFSYDIANVQTVLVDHAYFFGVPFVVTFLAIWYLPVIHNLAHRKYLKFRFSREMEFYTQQNDFDKKKNLLLKEQKINVQEQVKIVEDIARDTEKVKDAEQKIIHLAGNDELWRSEYEKIDKQLLTLSLPALKRIIYSNSGHVQRDSYNTDELSFLHANGLYDYAEGQKDQIFLTEKGKFFLRNHIAS